MRKTSFEYHIHGYRYAPESFHIYKGLPGQEKTELPLSDEQRYQMGYLYLTQGIKSAVDYVKHIERERERKCRLYMTYGFKPTGWTVGRALCLCWMVVWPL